jgi:hypothetical protein
MNPASRIIRSMVQFGLIGFIPGFFGPMLFAPGANQGPLLGILITGPIGMVIGLGIGLWREWTRRPDDPSPVPSSPAPRASDLARHPLARVAAALVALVLLAHGQAGLTQGAGREAAAAIVVAIVLGWFAATSKYPEWARRR